MALDTIVTGRIASFAGATGYGWVEAIGLRGGAVAAAGSRVDVEHLADAGTRRIELAPGEVALPSFVDAHIHLVDAAIAAESLDLFAAATIDDALAMVREAAVRIPAPGWILGSGWDQRRWGRWPTLADLDRAAPGRTVALRSFDLHALWASPAALAAASITRASIDPVGGIIRRSADGEPDGIFFEKGSELILGQVPKPSPAMVRRAIRGIGNDFLALGVTGAHEIGTLFPDTSNEALDVYAAMADAGDLPIRLRAGVRADGLENAISRGLRSGSRIGEADTSRLAFGWLKLFADGTLGSRTAALLEPREGTNERGLFTNPPEFLRERASKAAANGITTMIHTIGDAAVRTALDILGPTAATSTYMPRLEHVQLCHRDDRARFGRDGVAASVQPIHLREDANGARRDWGARAESHGYTWKTLLDDGATLAFGQDAPLEPLDPWPGIALVVTRRDPTWHPADPAFGSHEAITLEQALRASTVGVAQTVKDPLGGRLIEGSPADLQVLPTMPTVEEVGSASFEQVRPRLVLLGGAVAFER
jgi:predicted amidohydrolase YtcJ